MAMYGYHYPIGANSFLTKPIDFDPLYAKLDEPISQMTTDM